MNEYNWRKVKTHIEGTYAGMNHWVATDPFFKYRDVQLALHILWEYDDRLRVAFGGTKKGGSADGTDAQAHEQTR